MHMYAKYCDDVAVENNNQTPTNTLPLLYPINYNYYKYYTGNFET